MTVDTVVRTKRGALRGRTADGVTAFKGIPYAAPPFGARRLAAPQPAEPWDGVRDALRVRAHRAASRRYAPPSTCCCPTR